MIITRKLVTYGRNKAVTLPDEFTQGINPEDLVVLEIKLIKTLPDPKSHENIKEYKCLVCDHRFHTNPKTDDVYCTACSNDNMDAIEEVYA